MEKRSRVRFLVFCCVAIVVEGCSNGIEAPLDEARNPIVYGTDDRVETYEATSHAIEARVQESVAALIPKEFVDSVHGLAATTPNYGAVAGLCPGESFADQPAVALCTAVLLDWDLVLTAAHCVHAIPIENLAVVFGYYYDAAGRLSVGEEDVIDASEVVAEALDPPEASPRLDYAWIRLSRPVGAGRSPAPFRRSVGQTKGNALVFAGTDGGVPVKIDEGAHVYDARAPQGDFFVADTDTSAGASGGAAFDDALSLVGILARGEHDSILSTDGCYVEAHEPDTAAPQEQFTYAERAVTGLCSVFAEGGSTLCRSDCGDPCLALPKTVQQAQGGCSFAYRSSSGYRFGSLLLTCGVFARRRRVRRRGKVRG